MLIKSLTFIRRIFIIMHFMKKGISTLPVLLMGALVITFLSASGANSEILFADRFENPSNWDGRTNSVTEIFSTIKGRWRNIWCNPQANDSFGSIGDWGYTGKGFRFLITTDGCSAPSVAQESCLFTNDSTTLNHQSLFWGFRFKVSKTNWGTGGKYLKMTRFYASPNSQSPSIIPQWSAPSGSTVFNFYYNGNNHYTSYVLQDTSWHTYVCEFQRGNNNNDGIIRLWVDGALRYEDTRVNWGGTGTNFTYSNFPIMQGNMSGNYNGGDLYTYWDDFVWTTTKVEIEDFLEVQLGEGIPSPPYNLRIEE